MAWCRTGHTKYITHQPRFQKKYTLTVKGGYYVDMFIIMITLLPRYNTINFPQHARNKLSCAWWRHQMETFSALLALCAGNSPVIGEFPSQRPITQSFDISFHLRLNKRLSKQPRRRWLETPSSSLWRHCYGRQDMGCFWSTCICLAACNVVL